MEVRIRAVLALLASVLLSACGGSSSDSDFDGIWRGTYTPDGTYTFSIVAVAHGDTVYLYDINGLIYVLSKFTGPGDVGLTGFVYPAPGFIFTDDSLHLPAGLKGSISAGQINGTLTVNGAFIPLALDGYKPFAGDPSIVPGKWSGEYLSPNTRGVDIGSDPVQPLELTVAADGTFSGTNSAGCTLKGTITPVPNGDNMFEVSLVERGPNHCGGVMTALAYEGDTDEQNVFGHASGTYYYMVGSGKSAFAAEFRVH